MKPTNSTSQIQQEYQNLRNKVESEIEGLQKKLSHNTEIHYHHNINGVSRTVLEPSTQSEYHNSHKEDKKHHHHHYHNHHKSHHHNHSVNSMISCCHSHQNCCLLEKSCQCVSRKSSLSIHESERMPSISRANHISTTLLEPSTSTPVNIPLVNTKIFEHNLFLEQAFIKSIHTQQEMAENLRLLEEKISKLQSNSHIGKSENESKKQYKWRVLSEGEQNSQNAEGRARSLKNVKFVKNDARFNSFVLHEYSRKHNESGDSDGEKSKSRSLYKSSKKDIKSTKKPNPKYKKSATSSSNTSNQYLLRHPSHRIKSPKPSNLQNTRQNKSLSKNHINPDYYTINKLCPVHVNVDEIRLKSREKQVYQDSEHRNRKHQRDHLVQSFKQQDIARKKLMEKILKNSSKVNIKMVK